MNGELERFLKLFESLAVLTDKWMASTPDDKLDWVPFDNYNMKFGDRISTITIRSLYVHTIVGECRWARILKDCEEGSSLPREADKPLTDRLMASKTLVADANVLHRQNMALFAGYSDQQLAKNIQWTKREWTVMGFLWGIYCHRAYHLGNIDLYMREADAPTPDFFSSFQQVLA